MADSTGSGDPLNQIFRVVNAAELAAILETGQFPPSLSGFGEKQFWQTINQATTWQTKVTNAGWESNTSIVSTLVRGETLQQAVPVNEPGVGMFYSFGSNAMPALNAPDFDTFFTKPLILLESKNKLGTTLKVSVDYLIR